VCGVVDLVWDFTTIICSGFLCIGTSGARYGAEEGSRIYALFFGNCDFFFQQE